MGSPALNRRRVSVRDVAAHAGVSTQTVSRVVNNAASVSPATRALVTAAIEALGYQRSELARSLNEGRTRTFGIVFSGHDMLGGLPINRGLAAEAELLGYSLLLKEAEEGQAAPDLPWLSSLLSRQVDGILWMLPTPKGDEHDEVIRKLIEIHGVPVVGLTTAPRRGFPSVSFDNHAAGMLATEHLIARGRRHIGHISGRPGTWDAWGRRDGWRSALTAAGLAASADLLVEGDWNPESGNRGLRQLLQQRPALDAVFAANDSTALGVLHAARELGLRVPEDLAVVGVDNIRGAAYFGPPLTTIRQNQSELGRNAVRLLASLADARFGGPPVTAMADHLQAPELLVRQST